MLLILCSSSCCKCVILDIDVFYTGVVRWGFGQTRSGGIGCTMGGMGGGMRRKRHQTRSKIINRLSAEH